MCDQQLFNSFLVFRFFLGLLCSGQQPKHNLLVHFFLTMCIVNRQLGQHRNKNIINFSVNIFSLTPFIVNIQLGALISREFFNNGYDVLRHVNKLGFNNMNFTPVIGFGLKFDMIYYLIEFVTTDDKQMNTAFNLVVSIRNYMSLVAQAPIVWRVIY